MFYSKVRRRQLTDLSDIFFNMQYPSLSYPKVRRALIHEKIGELMIHFLFFFISKNCGADYATSHRHILIDSVGIFLFGICRYASMNHTGVFGRIVKDVLRGAGRLEPLKLIGGAALRRRRDGMRPRAD